MAKKDNDPNDPSQISLSGPFKITIEQGAEAGAPASPKGKKPRLSKEAVELLKWVLSTFILGLASTIATCNYQKQELAIKRVEADSKLISIVSQKYDSTYSKDLDLMIGYYTFISPLITTSELRDSVRSFLGYLKEINKLPAELTELADSLTAPPAGISPDLLTDSDTKVKSAQQKPLASLDDIEEKRLGISSDTMGSTALDKQREKTLRVSDSIRDKLLEVQPLLQTTLNDKNYDPVNTATMQWFKVGYYLEFNGTLRIGLNQLDKERNVIYVTLSEITGDTALPLSGKDNVAIALGSSYTFDHGEYKYVISLDYIGSAGKNPWNKAAYISVSTYQKN